MALKSKAKEMTGEEFLVWCLDQEEKYEFVDGFPVLLHQPINGLSGATERHDMVVVNLIARLHAKLRGGPCRPTTSDQAVRTSIKKFRRPDVTIECGPRDPDALEVRQPVVVFEVMSPSNRPSEVVSKIEEYKRNPAIMHIVLIEPAVITITVLSRGVDGLWTDRTLTDLSDVLVLDPPKVELALTEIYEGTLDGEPAG